MGLFGGKTFRYYRASHAFFLIGTSKQITAVDVIALAGCWPDPKICLQMLNMEFQ